MCTCRSLSGSCLWVVQTARVTLSEQWCTKVRNSALNQRQDQRVNLTRLKLQKQCSELEARSTGQSDKVKISSLDFHAGLVYPVGQTVSQEGSILSIRIVLYWIRSPLSIISTHGIAHLSRIRAVLSRYLLYCVTLYCIVWPCIVLCDPVLYYVTLYYIQILYSPSFTTRKVSRKR